MFILMLVKLNRKYSFFNRLKNLKGLFLRIIILSILSLLFVMNSDAQNNNLSFEVWKNKSHIGFISINEKIVSDSVVYDLSSEIKAKVLVKFEVSGVEKTIFKNGMLVYSSVYRKLNSKEKVNKELLFIDGKYLLINGGRKRALSINKIRSNLVTLYFYEPINISLVYCDYHNAMASVILIEKGKYQVTFPDGSYNVFYYKNGKCKKVDAFTSLYEVQLISTL
tara:strand:+ start:272 stop:940 length:669 start_codon:yes stop_codon:yes gene_type:complete